jgi:hypothetical protein
MGEIKGLSSIIAISFQSIDPMKWISSHMKSRARFYHQSGTAIKTIVMSLLYSVIADYGAPKFNFGSEQERKRYPKRRL